MSHATPMALASAGNDARRLRLRLGHIQIGDDDPRARQRKSRAGLGSNTPGPAEDQDDFFYFFLHGWKIRAYHTADPIPPRQTNTAATGQGKECCCSWEAVRRSDGDGDEFAQRS